MGIGGGIFLIAFGAILAFAVHAKVGWLDIDVAGGVIMLSGVAVLAITVWFWRDRRRRAIRSIIEEAKLSHPPGPSAPPPPPPPPPMR
jgi:membrane protein implicated in regulation of membrane protease activity